MTATASHSNTIRVGIVGLGFMGRTHFHAFTHAASLGYPCSIVAVADRSALDKPAPLGNLATANHIDLASVDIHSSADELFARADIDLVSICTPTDTHLPLATAALRAGKHVLLEKPVANSSAAVQSLLDESRKHPRQLVMPAMCMRFWPGWDWLRDQIALARDGSSDLGPFLGVTFQRIGSSPTWNHDFYLNPDRSGGALLDLHIHDADFIYWTFGVPSSLHAVGSVNHITTSYSFPSSPSAPAPNHVIAQGGWLHAPGFPFTMRFTALFQNATAVYDLALADKALTLYRDAAASHIPLSPATAYQAQAMHFLDAVRAARSGQSPKLRATLDDALAVAKIIELERAALL